MQGVTDTILGVSQRKVSGRGIAISSKRERRMGHLGLAGFDHEGGRVLRGNSLLACLPLGRSAYPRCRAPWGGRPVLGRVASLGDAHSGNNFEVSSCMLSVISGEAIAFNFCGSITGEDHWLARSRHRWANCRSLPLRSRHRFAL